VNFGFWFKALNYYEKAFMLDTQDSQILMELDSLYKKLNRSTTERLSFLTKNEHLAEQRNDL